MALAQFRSHLPIPLSAYSWPTIEIYEVNKPVLRTYCARATREQQGAPHKAGLSRVMVEVVKRATAGCGAAHGLGGAVQLCSSVELLCLLFVLTIRLTDCGNGDCLSATSAAVVESCAVLPRRLYHPQSCTKAYAPSASL